MQAILPLVVCPYLIEFNMKRLQPYLFCTLAMLVLFSCKKEDPAGEEIVSEEEEEEVASIPEDNFAYLYQQVFRPTCANSGCHDGNFEPDFRTIHSAYNSLVNQPVIINDPDLTFTYRVKPGDASLSLLYERLTVDIPGTQGQMPISLEPDSDWPERKDEYIDAIRTWINNGAPNMYGEYPGGGNLNPTVVGFQVLPSGNTSSPYTRTVGAGNQPFQVPTGQVDFWYAFDDDQTATGSLVVQEVKVSPIPYDFDNADVYTPIAASATFEYFDGSSGSFSHKCEVDLSAYSSGQLVYARVYVKDEHHSEPAEIPTDGTDATTYLLFTIRIT